jgi:hypothetical protein
MPTPKSKPSRKKKPVHSTAMMTNHSSGSPITPPEPVEAEPVDRPWAHRRSEDP